MRGEVIRPELDALAASLVEYATRPGSGITEGTVMSEAPSYRRLDYGAHALAYVRVRVRRGAVRVDVTGYWPHHRVPLPAAPHLRCHSSLAFAVKTEDEARAVARWLADVVRAVKTDKEQGRDPRKVGQVT